MPGGERGHNPLSPPFINITKGEARMKVQLIEKPTIEEKNDIAIVIFPSRPYWFSATKEIRKVLDIFQEGINEEIIIKNIAIHLDTTLTEAMETFKEVRDLLYCNGVLSINGNTSREAELIEPHFQVNAVENVLVIAATQECNLSCQHCYANAKKPLRNEMTTKELKSLVNDLAFMPWKNDVSRVALTGGEFFIRPDALEIIDHVHTKGFKVLLSTNGLLLNDEIISRLANYAASLKISVSLDGPTAKIHEIIRGEGTFNQTIMAIQKLAVSGVSVGANMFVHQDNVNLIEETLHLAETLGVKAFNCLNLMRVGRANSQRSQKELIRIPEHILYRNLFSILRYNLRYQELMKNSTFANQIMGIAGGVKSHYCGIGTNRATYVRANGDIYPCPDTALPKFLLGNVKNKQLHDIWEHSPLLDELRRLDVDTMNPICAKCDVRYFCGGNCRGENYQVTKELRSPHFNCDEIRKTILEMMWMLTEDPTFFQDKVNDLYQAVCF
ncbi:MAG TPA: radical SAM protein [Candidatus Paceibacterota bacterium]